MTFANKDHSISSLIRKVSWVFILSMTCSMTNASTQNDCTLQLVTSFIDGVQRKAELCVASKQTSPLLVYLPEWGGGHSDKNYVKHLAADRGWNLLIAHPRAANDGEIGSKRTIQDVVDAVKHAKATIGQSPSKTYALGLSGGGYLGLMIAYKHPLLFDAISVWAAITNLKDWHDEMSFRANSLHDQLTKLPNDQIKGAYEQYDMYRKGIENSIQSPLEYISRSPVHGSSTLKKVKIDLNAGITDGHHGTVAVSHSLNLFNKIAIPKDRLSKEDFERLTSGNSKLFPSDVADPSYGSKRVLFRRTSGNLRLTVFDGDHEMIPSAAISWLSRQ